MSLLVSNSSFFTLFQDLNEIDPDVVAFCDGKEFLKRLELLLTKTKLWSTCDDGNISLNNTNKL